MPAASRTSLPELEQAMIAALKSDAPFVALVTGIFDQGAVPVGQPFPYVALNMGHEGPENAFGRRGYTARPIVNIYSAYRGNTECYQILNRMNALLDQQQLTLATHSLVYLLFDDAFPLNAPGLDNIHQLSVRYKYFSQEPASTFSGSYYQNVLQDTPIFYARLNEASGVIAHDASGNQAGSISSSGVTYSLQGAIARDNDHCFRLDGSTGCVLAPIGITIASGFTVEMWVRPTTVPLSGNPRIVANSHTDADNNGFQLLLNNNGNGGAFFVGNGTNNQNVYFNGLFSTTQWTHVAVTFDGSTMTVYLNGVSVGSASYAATIAATIYPIAFGKNPAYNGDYFAGNIDELAVYQTALSAARVLAHYQSGS